MSDPTQSERRQTADRRNKATRRRHAETRRLHVELCHSVLRVVLVIDDDTNELPLLRARTVRWRKAANSLTCEQGRAELATALRSIVLEDRLAGCSVSLAISSTLCVNRATSGASTKVEQEITELKDRSQLYLSLGPGPKTSAVGRKQIDARHEHALVTVTNQRTLELLVHAAESAGLVVDAVESALVALARLQGRLEEDDSAVVLAQLDEDRFEIGVSRQGQLLLEYRPSAEATVAQLGDIVDDHHERLVRFCARQYGVGDMAIDRMWLVGEPDEVEATDSKTKTALKTRVLPLDRLTEYWRLAPAESVTAEMGAALGLALRGRFDETGVSPNLMHEILARAKAPIRPFLIRAIAPVAASLLLAAGLWVFNLEQRLELTAMRERVAEVKPAMMLGKRLARQITDSANEIQHLEKLVARTPVRHVGPLVVRLGQCLPEDVWLKDMRLTESSQVTLAGASYTEGGVYDFVRYLEESPDFQEVALRGTGVDQTPKGPATSFDIDLELAPATPAPTGASK